MAIDRILQSPVIQNITSKASKGLNKASCAIGSAFEKSPVADVFNKYIEPVGANNKFLTLAGFMVACIITPRVMTALKRNPDNKEATVDEIKEILFRDVQSVLVVLFMLKSLNAIISAGVSKKSGLPMTSKQYEKLFDSSLKGFKEKARDFMKNPLDKFKKIGKNILNTLHPTEGVRAKVNGEYISEYSNYTFEQLPKMFKRIQDEKGDSVKVFNKIIDGTIKEYESILNGSSKTEKSYGIVDYIRIGMGKKGTYATNLPKTKENAQATIDALKQLQGKGPEILSEVKDKSVQEAIESYIKNRNNSLVMSGKGANGWLRTFALALEAGYLGFGIPALNQLRLEKKYLREHKGEKKVNTDYDKYGTSLINKNIKAHQVKLYHNFIK